MFRCLVGSDLSDHGQDVGGCEGGATAGGGLEENSLLESDEAVGLVVRLVPQVAELPDGTQTHTHFIRLTPVLAHVKIALAYGHVRLASACV